MRCRTASKAGLGAVYIAIGQPERWAELCRAQLARRRDTHVAHPGMAGFRPCSGRFAVGRRWIAADGLIEAAEATGNPSLLAFALGAYGSAFRDADPVGALDALRRGLVIAQDSGNRSNASALANVLARLEAEHGDTAGRARSPHSGDPQLPQCGQHHDDPHPAGRPRRSFRPARTLRTGGHHRRVRPQSILSRRAFPEITTAIAHLREVLGDQTYESLARKGETMTTAAMVTYAYDQIDQARTELNAVSERQIGLAEVPLDRHRAASRSCRAVVSVPPASAPSGVVTFLFTDVEGSTRRWEADADAMRVALAAHDEVLRRAIEAHGGWLFKHTGDGVCAAFASPQVGGGCGGGRAAGAGVAGADGHRDRRSRAA